VSRAALKWAVALTVVLCPAALRGGDPHVDPRLVPDGCNSCHRGHGLSRSPMLAAPQVEVCLSCHGSEARGASILDRGAPAAASRRQVLSTALNQPFVHPIDDQAFSRREPGVVTCTSCHSPHRGSVPADREATTRGIPKLSTRDPGRLEFELCESCHGRTGSAGRLSRSVGELLEPRNRSYHPVKAPSKSGAPSVAAELAGREINCTDCHGNSDPRGARGPHGSAVASLLVAEYVGMDGSGESAATYELCYECHDRQRVLDSPLFPQHRLHVVDARSSCATCHDAHGSVSNRALIRFGDADTLSTTAPSGLTGQLRYVSDAPGSGACYLTCHGYDHAPAAYGAVGVGTRERLPLESDRLPRRTLDDAPRD